MMKTTDFQEKEVGIITHETAEKIAALAPTAVVLGMMQQSMPMEKKRRRKGMGIMDLEVRI